MLADRFPSYSICGLPYLLSGDVPDWRALAHHGRDQLEHAGIELLLEHPAERIDPQTRTVTVRASAGERNLRYDRLIVATGARPVRPRIPGIDRDGVYQLHTIGDGLALQEALARGPQRAVIVGAGYIGLEMAEALRSRGLAVTVVEQLPNVLPTVDAELGSLVKDELERHDVRVVNDVAVTAIDEHRSGLVVRGAGELALDADVVLVVVGVRPEVTLGVAAGIETGERGALRVNRRMETGLADVYAAGDCATTYHRVLDADTYLPLGTTAHKQGRAAGENALGGDRRFEGSLGTQVVKIFDLAAARTGLRDHEARTAGLQPLTVESRGYDHTVSYPGAREITMRLTGDERTERLLGAQLVGHIASEVPKRGDVVAAALYQGMTVSALNDLDLSYTPPFGSPWDAIQVAAQDWGRVSP